MHLPNFRAVKREGKPASTCNVLYFHIRLCAISKEKRHAPGQIMPAGKNGIVFALQPSEYDVVRFEAG
jgi:hypothetical protein